MSYYIREWILWLKQVDALAGIPLVVAALALMLGGWRIWKVAVVLTLGLLGLGVGVMLGDTPSEQQLYGAIGFAVVAAASFPPVFYAVAVLGGIIGAGLVNYLAEGMGLDGQVLWVITAIGLIVATALSFINLRQVIIAVTAVEGGVLLLSAVVAMLSKVPGPFNYFRQMAFETSIFVPFLVLVPAVVGAFLQAADANQRGFTVTRT